eukprot:5850693-Prymnesium_polylepis.1
MQDWFQQRGARGTPGGRGASTGRGAVGRNVIARATSARRADRQSQSNSRPRGGNPARTRTIPPVVA